MSHLLPRSRRIAWTLALAPSLLWLAACSTSAPPPPPPIPAPTAAPTAAGAPESPTAPAGIPAAAAAPVATATPVESRPALPSWLQPAPTPLRAVLNYADRVRTLPAGELSAEINRMGDPVDAPLTQMQLGLALAQTRSSSDLTRAVTQLQKVVNNPSPDAQQLQPLARLLIVRYQEQRRVEEDRDRQAQQARDAQRRIDQLNDRIEALRAIERSFSRPVDGKR